MKTVGLQPQGADAVQQLLNSVERRFYRALPARTFHRDRRMIVYALTWPSVWLHGRGLTCSPARYNLLIAERLDAIAAHGDPCRFGAYFPAYLLKCLQDWFQHHGDELYDELKHVRNAIDQLLTSVCFAANVQNDARHVELLASAHRLIQARCTRHGKSDPHQLSLF